jgi:hypothetical protein
MELIDDAITVLIDNTTTMLIYNAIAVVADYAVKVYLASFGLTPKQLQRM